MTTCAYYIERVRVRIVAAIRIGFFVIAAFFAAIAASMYACVVILEEEV